MKTILIRKVMGETLRELRVNAGMTVLIISRAFLAVRENFVGLFGFLEVFFSFRVVRVAVRVMFHGQLAVGLLDFVIGGVTIDAENVVKVAFCHGFESVPVDAKKGEA